MPFTLKQARIGAGLTQREIAKKMGMCAQTYSKYEKNPENMSIENAYAFSEAVGLKLEDIIFFNINSN